MTRRPDPKQAAIREAFHVALDAGVITGVDLRVADRPALDRWIKRLRDAGWTIPDPTLQTNAGRRDQWWHTYGWSEGGAIRGASLATESEPMPADEPSVEPTEPTP